MSSRSAPAGASLPIIHSHHIDPRGQRFGAGVSAAILGGALALGLPWLAALVGLNLAVSAGLGTRYFLPGRAWPLVRRTLGLGPVQPEHDYPPRFAQALGAAFIGMAVVLFLAALAPLGWLFVLAVAGLQALLAATGICVGCRLYVLRWWVPSAFARLIGRTDGLVQLKFGTTLRRPDA